MSTEKININKTEIADFEFELQLKGIDADKSDIRFILKSEDGIGYLLPCEKVENKDSYTYIIKNEYLKQLKTGKYECCVELIADNYLFKALECSLDVEVEPEAKAEIVNVEVDVVPTKDEEVKDEEVKDEEVKESSWGNSTIKHRIENRIANNKEKPSRDKKVKNLLKSLNL